MSRRSPTRARLDALIFISRPKRAPSAHRVQGRLRVHAPGDADRLRAVGLRAPHEPYDFLDGRDL